MNSYNLSIDSSEFDILEKTKGTSSGDNFIFVTKDELDILKKQMKKSS